MKPLPRTFHFKRQTPFLGLDEDQRSLVEFVSASQTVSPLVRERAQALLMLDNGEPLVTIAQQLAKSTRSLRALIHRQAEGGVRAALLQRSKTRPGQRAVQRLLGTLESRAVSPAAHSHPIIFS